MNNGSYRFTVGRFECFAISDGTNLYTDPVSLLFANAQPVELEQVLHAYHIQPTEWAMHGLAEWLNDARTRL